MTPLVASQQISCLGRPPPRTKLKARGTKAVALQVSGTISAARTTGRKWCVPTSLTPFTIATETTSSSWSTLACSLALLRLVVKSHELESRDQTYAAKPSGLAFYHALVDELIANNIVPILTLYLGICRSSYTRSSLFKAGCTQTSSTTTVPRLKGELTTRSRPKARIGITLNSDAAYSLDERNPLDVACSGKEDAVRTVLVPLTSGYWRLSGNHAGTSGRSLAEIHNRGDGAIEGIVQQQALSSSSWRPTQPVPTTKYGRFFLFHSGVHHLVGLKVDTHTSRRPHSPNWFVCTKRKLVRVFSRVRHLVGLLLRDAEPGKEALHVPKLRLVFIKEHRQGAISMSRSSASQMYVVTLSEVKDFVMYGDVYKSIHFLPKDYEPLAVSATSFSVYEKKLALLVVDMDENLHVMQLAPQNYRVSRWPASAASERLPLGCPSLEFVPEAGRCHPLVPVGKGVFRRLFKLQNDMVNTLPQNCALKTSGVLHA
ncbi:hypothetical protein PInf_020411 [Phytophthora infestans]|nr:hypothetical protein PInf_020411 [Phytophthora infestans]